MSSKHSPAKVTLGMIKGKPITMSVPVIRYHASEEELEELYPSCRDDEKQQLTPESEKPSPNRSSPEEGSLVELRRSTSMDESFPEGLLTPAAASDPWKVLSDIRGKITKTFEEKLHEIKSEKKKSKHERSSRDTSSVSDYEDLAGDATPTEEQYEKEEKRFASSLRKRSTPHSSRFVGFSYIKTGLKDQKSAEEECVESGIEAAELTCECPSPDVDSSIQRIMKSDQLFIQLKNRIYAQLLLLVIVVCCCYFIPLPKYLMGLWAGIFVSFMLQRAYTTVHKLLSIPVKPSCTVPVLEVAAVEEHAVVEKFEGWLNELPYRYEPDNYHVARTKPVFFKLEGDVLQVMESRTRIAKRAIWDEAKLKPKFTKKRAYSLAGAKVELLPSGLIRRRRWSKKYPICVTFDKDTALKENSTIDNSSDDEPQLLDNEKGRIIMEEDETDDDFSQSRDIFEDCRDEDVNEEEMRVKIYIFARTDRQKEDWFRRLAAASQLGSKRSSISSLTIAQSSSESKAATPSATEMSSVLTHQAYMARYTEVAELPSAGMSHDGLWINALLGRILFDMHKSPDTISVIQDKIQRKLSNIKLPYFMESLSVSELVIGQGAPIIHNATKPTMDERGLWFDLDITYEGSLTMTIETKLNLMKLKRANSSPSSCSMSDILRIDKPAAQPAKSPMFDSDVEDSPETSTEDEDSAAELLTHKPTTSQQSSGKKFLSMVDKLASNKYFQHATELSYVKRAMEGVSNTEIRLMVSVSSIEGCLAVNIPPPPSDRLWYGFKPVPKINLSAKPAVGERAFNINYVTKWIETKLLREFEKIVVIPNMDDLVIPLCPNYPYAR
ncbi:testis-expressed protein 2 [Nasonia vitripennis]|uniref:SMP-LTD domain-containing protein n=1 Tax=Nasonia vitripennis TaxID=7425 RepID=A0A7M7G944_NASVI|nr:testis-expressed protein 2 [Nasonia vitripennis]